MRFTAQEITENIVLPLWNGKALNVVDQFFAEDVDIRTTFLAGKGPDTLKKSIQDTFIAFPNFEITVDEVIQNHNKLMYKWQATAKHEGNILGISATGLETQFSGMVFGEIENDKISLYHSFSNIPQVLHAICEQAQAESSSSSLVSNETAALSHSLRDVTAYPLTKREMQCLGFWIKGCSIKESAKQMGGLSERTVQTYRENIKQKFRARNFQALLSIVQQCGAMPLILGG